MNYSLGFGLRAKGNIPYAVTIPLDYFCPLRHTGSLLPIL